MLDIKQIQENPQELKSMLEARFYSPDSGTIDEQISSLLKLNDEAKELRAEAESLRGKRNSASKEIGKLIGQGKKEEAETQKEEVRKIGDSISEIEAGLAGLDLKIRDILLSFPNYIHPDVPTGPDESANIEIRKWGSKPEFDFKPAAHYDMGEKSGILNFEKGVKLAGSRFYTYFDLAARLERAIISFMLDTHTGKNGYTEVWVPALITDAGMETTGQYPKFKGEYYRLDRDELSLIPTAEVPLVNLYRDELIPDEDLPLSMTAQTSCYRREAGAAGKDTRGLVRVHQFQKVELVQIVRPEESEELHMKMLSHAEGILQALNLHYRVLLLSSGDMGATATKTYDLEVWMPGLDRWLEISSVSNCLDFQARRGMIRIKKKGEPNRYAHTLNGSGLAAGRTMIAIMENYQKKDGSFDIPEVLQPYLNRGR